MHQALSAWQRRAGQSKRQTYAVYLAMKDPRTPWYARVTAGLVIAYAFSPIDLIPDFIPVLGYLDDLVLIPLGIALTIRLIPPDVLAESRRRADEVMAGDKPTSRAAAVVIVAIWLLAAATLIALIVKLARS